jgi:hypothetical protein
MKPSISVIAAARRFLVPTDPSPNLSRFERKKERSVLTPGKALHFSSATSLFLMRGDVDSLLGSNFYGDASSNISGLRLLALVFDERTS